MNETITIEFIGSDENGRATGQVRHSKNCNASRLAEGAQALMYLAATKSQDGFEKEIENITHNVMLTKAKRIQ